MTAGHRAGSPPPKRQSGFTPSQDTERVHLLPRDRAGSPPPRRLARPRERSVTLPPVLCDHVCVTETSLHPLMAPRPDTRSTCPRTTGVMIPPPPMPLTCVVLCLLALGSVVQAGPGAGTQGSRLSVDSTAIGQRQGRCRVQCMKKVSRVGVGGGGGWVVMVVVGEGG